MKRAALIAVAVLLSLTPLVLHARTTTTFGQNAVGAVCNNVEKGVDFDAIAQCNAGTGAGTMQTAPIILGTLTAPPYANTTCDSGKAGMLQWTGTSFQACGGTSWGSLAAGGALDDLTDAKTDYASLYNVFLGSGAGDAITGGSNNTALGYFALYSNTTGSDNTALGSTALYSNTTGSWNTAVGREALYSNSTGASNTALGMRALRTNSTGHSNTAVGRDALYSNTSGHANTALGYYALPSTTTGFGNTAIGYNALYSNTSGVQNVALGAGAQYANSTGNYNTALGVGALQVKTTGSNNTALGYGVGQTTLTTGSNNILIGTSSAVTTPASDTSNFLNIGNTIYGNLATGYVGIGTTSPHVPLHVAAHGASGIAYFTNSDFVNASTGSGVYFGTGTSSGNTYSLLQAGINGGSNAGDLILNPYSGNVGIGTATPQALLHVNGSARIGSEAGGNLGVGAYSTSGSSIFTLGYEGGGAASAYVGYATAGASTLHVGYQTGANVAAVYVGNGASTGGTILELGAGSTGNHSSFIDITGDATYSDYGLRIARGSGPNGGSYLTSRGTGDLFLQTAEAGDIGFNTSGARRMTILATGEVGIANAAPAFKLDVLGDINATRGNGTGVFYFASNTLRYLYYNGTSYILPSASLVVNGTTYPSDRRLKTDIEPISKDSAMGVINKLEPKRFHWHPDSEQGKVNKNYDFGMIAQDVQKILPEVVLETDSTGPGSADGKKAEPKTLNEKLGKTLAIDYTRFVPWLLAGLQEVAKQLKELEARVNALLDFEPRIKKLEAENEKLKAVNDTLNARLKAIEDRLSKKP